MLQISINRTYPRYLLNSRRSPLGKKFFQPIDITTTSFYVSGIKIPGHPVDGEIWHPVRSLKPHRMAPSKVDSPKSADNMLVACGTNDKLHPARTLRRGLGRDERLGRHFSASPKPLRRHQKRPTPSACYRLARGTHVTLWQDGEPRGPPNRGTHSQGWDGHDRAQLTGARKPHA
jgi:hypothetical protein